jgi:hypothetical protein
MMSPASSGVRLEMCSMSVGTLKIRSRVFDDCSVSPLMVSEMSRVCGSGTSSPVTIAGPSGEKVGNDLPRVHCEVASWMSRALTSLTMACR